MRYVASRRARSDPTYRLRHLGKARHRDAPRRLPLLDRTVRTIVRRFRSGFQPYPNRLSREVPLRGAVVYVGVVLLTERETCVGTSRIFAHCYDKCMKRDIHGNWPRPVRLPAARNRPKQQVPSRRASIGRWRTMDSAAREACL